MAKPCILFYQVIPMLLLCTEPGSSDSRKDRTIKADYGAFEGSSICILSSHLEQRHVPELEETPFCKPSSTTALQAVPIRAKPDRTHASGFGTRRQDTMAKPCILFYQVIPMLLLCTEPGSSDSRKDRTIKADYGAFEGSSICILSSHLEQRHVPELEETPFCKPSSTTALQAVPIRAKPDRTHASGFGTRRQDTMAKPCILFYQSPRTTARSLQLDGSGGIQLRWTMTLDVEGASSNATGVIPEPAEKLKMKDLLQPYKLGEDIGLFLVNFERTCEKMKFQRETWSQKLLALLPCEAADVKARLSKEEADDYVKVKAALLKKYRLSTEAFRQSFRQDTRKPTQSWPEFAYNLKADLVEWLESAGAHGDHDKVLECVATEHLFTELSEPAKFWIQDREQTDEDGSLEW
ncbi:uncharacterized protein ISCGN_007160 [Ixodes scapularis]